MEDRAAPYLRRLEEVRARLAPLSTIPAPGALTDADGRTGERWDWGQVWAHTAEFPAYWTRQLRRGLDDDSGEPVPFGRVSSDPDRVAAIERDRVVPPAELWARLQPDLDAVRSLVEGLDERGWAFRGLHSTLGVLSMDHVLNEFVVGHLEGHAAQLEGLVTADGG